LEILVEKVDDRIAAHRPRISVVTVFYNRATEVEASVGSLLRQSEADIEIIVVDDGSRDGTPDMVRACADQRIRLIEKANGGFTKAIRAGIAAAHADYIAIHGSGDWSHPERLRRQAETLDSDPAVGIVGCWVENADVGRSTYSLFQPPNGLDFREALLVRNLFTHGEVMFRRRLYEEIGGYRSFFRFAQDIDLWLRMSSKASYRILEDVLYRRRSMPGGVSASPEKVFHQQKFVEFARQCAESVDAGDGDLLDKHGTAAVFHMRPSRRVGHSLAVAGASFMVNVDPARGWQLVKAAMREGLAPYVIATYLIMLTHRNERLFRSFVVPLIRRLRRS
jgi:hypothetical protein